jgi:hypothetical protein
VNATSPLSSLKAAAFRLTVETANRLTSLPEAPIHVQIDVLRPTSFSAYTLDWNL